MTIVSFTNPLDAKEKILEEQDYDILLVDNIMPELEGLELIEIINEVCNPYIIMITSATKSKLVKRSQLYDFLLSKPIVLEDLKEMLNILISYVEEGKKKIIEKESELIFSDKKDKETDRRIIKYLNFIKRAIYILLNDESAKKGKIYKQLCSEMERDQSTIRKYLNKIINEINIDILKQNFGFKSKPKNIDFLLRLIEKVEEKIRKEKEKKEAK